MCTFALYCVQLCVNWMKSHICWQYISIVTSETLVWSFQPSIGNYKRNSAKQNKYFHSDAHQPVVLWTVDKIHRGHRSNLIIVEINPGAKKGIAMQKSGRGRMTSYPIPRFVHERVGCDDGTKMTSLIRWLSGGIKCYRIFSWVRQFERNFGLTRLKECELTLVWNEDWTQWDCDSTFYIHIRLNTACSIGWVTRLRTNCVRQNCV